MIEMRVKISNTRTETEYNIPNYSLTELGLMLIQLEKMKRELLKRLDDIDPIIEMSK
jgi:hypothetical protein